MADRKIVQLFPVDESPDSDERAARARADAERADQERRETHIREEVAKIPPLPQGVEALATYGAQMSREIRIDLIHMRVHGAHARDVQSSETRDIHSKLDWIIGSLGGLGRHVKQHDSVSNEIQLEQAEQAEKLESARRVATEAKDAASGVRVDVDELKRLASQERWAQRGKVGTAIGAVVGALETIARLSGQDGVIGLVTKMFGGH
jgi:hypothetical protein